MITNINMGICEYKSFVPEKVEQFLALLQDPEIQSFLKLFVENTLATSDLRILKRLSKVESMLGLSDFDNEKPSIPKRLERLEEMELMEMRTSAIDAAQIPDMPETVTDIRTDFLVKHLEENKDIPKIQNEGFELPYINTREFKIFINNILPEKLRPKSLKNLRKIKKDCFENAVLRYGNKGVTINKSKHSNRELKLVMSKVIPNCKAGVGVTG